MSDRASAFIVLVIGLGGIAASLPPLTSALLLNAVRVVVTMGRDGLFVL
jgi:hypothetical protein